MSFTVKQIFPAINIPEEGIKELRMAVGMGIRDSWIDLHKSPPPKVEEDGYLACSYDDSFKKRAVAIITRYLAKHQTSEAKPVEPLRKKRPRRQAMGYTKV